MNVFDIPCNDDRRVYENSGIQKAAEEKGAKVYFADYYAKKAFDRELFIATLEDVLKTPADIEVELTLLNSVAHNKARKMIAEADDYF